MVPTINEVDATNGCEKTERRCASELNKTPKCHVRFPAAASLEAHERREPERWLWFQVDLGFLRFVTAIGTQGAISKETKKPYFVRSYKVDVSSTGEDWVTVKDNSKPKVTFASSSKIQTAALPLCAHLRHFSHVCPSHSSSKT